MEYSVERKRGGLLLQSVVASFGTEYGRVFIPSQTSKAEKARDEIIPNSTN